MIVKVLFSVGKSSINGSSAMFDYWTVSLVNHQIYVKGVEHLWLLMRIGFIVSQCIPYTVMVIVTILQVSPNIIPSGNQTWIDRRFEA